MKYSLAAAFIFLSTHAFAHNDPVGHMHVGSVIEVAVPTALIFTVLILVVSFGVVVRNAQTASAEIDK